MKKATTLLLTLCAALSLCSCKVNWFTTTIDVPWYVMMLTVVLPVAIALIISYRVLMSRTYICPECKTEFSPKWYQLSVAVHFMGKRLATCPHCGRRGFCHSKR